MSLNMMDQQVPEPTNEVTLKSLSWLSNWRPLSIKIVIILKKKLRQTSCLHLDRIAIFYSETYYDNALVNYILTFLIKTNDSEIPY